MYDFMSLGFNINKENVIFYGYRQASPKVSIVSFERDDSEIKRLEKRLYKLTGATADNHVLFEVKLGEHVLALQFSDDKMRLGLGVEKKSW